MIDSLCNPCGMAQAALAANTDCVTGSTNASTICMGTCRNLIDDIINNCNASVSEPKYLAIAIATAKRPIIYLQCYLQIASNFNASISVLCNGNTGDACTTAQTALATNAGCAAAFATADTSAICMGACRSLFDDIISNCDAAVSLYSYNYTYRLWCLLGSSQLYVLATCKYIATSPSFLIRTISIFIQTGAAYSTAISTLCNGTNTGACTTAVFSVSDTCLSSLANGSTSVCSGTCATQLSVVVSACGTSGVS